MKVKKYTRISIIVLGFAIAALLLTLVSYASGTGFLAGLNAGFVIGYYSFVVIVPISVIASLISVIKERTLLSTVLFLISLSLAVGFMMFYFGE